MKTLAAGEFKAKCLAVMDEVQTKRESVIITKRGKPVVQINPIEGQRRSLFGSMKDEMIILGDIVGPVVPPEDWKDYE